EGMNFKGANRVLIIGCHEHDQRPPFHRQLCQYAEAVHSRHPHVKENKIGREALVRGNSLSAIHALPDYFHVWLSPQQRRDHLASGRFVIDDQSANLHLAAGAIDKKWKGIETL